MAHQFCNQSSFHILAIYRHRYEVIRHLTIGQKQGEWHQEALMTTLMLVLVDHISSLDSNSVV